jgi:hypothetical protein
MNKALENEMSELFDMLVPSMGKADTEAGEIVRAYNRIAYRYYNDGDKLGIGYGNETCNAAGRYLLKHDHDQDGILACVRQMWGNWSDSQYEESLDELGWAVLDLIGNVPDTLTNETEDMWDHFDRFEDVDDTEEDEWDDEEW